MKRTRDVVRHFWVPTLLALVATFVLNPAALAQLIGDWDAVGSLNVPREGHTATLLANGKVLVVAGYDETGFTSSAEIYDPTSETWTVTGSLIAPRSFHTATLLADGRILVTGGYRYVKNEITVLNSAELYDPATGLWSVTGNLNIARREHKAVMLPNGTVLVVAGWNGGFLSSAELYDPATGTWSITGNLKTARGQPTATLLPDGKVLVVGGFTGFFPGGSCPCRDPVTSTAELYDPATGAWSFTASLNIDRSLHTATLLQNGKVLIAGGTDGLLIDAGEYVPLASAELYDQTNGSWSVTGRLNLARNLHTATLLSTGKVLAATGYYTDSAELYDQETGTWSFTGSLNTIRVAHTATLLPSGEVLVVSGARAELYDPTGVATVTPPLMIGASVLPHAEVGVAYSARSDLIISGGVAPYIVAITQGKLPAGLSLGNDGVLSGTPSPNAKSAKLTVRVTDSFNHSVTQTFNITVVKAIRIEGKAKAGRVGRDYRAFFKNKGGLRPLTWSITSGALPSGLSFDTTTGAITGIPTEAGEFPLTVQATDGLGGVDSENLTLTIR